MPARFVMEKTHAIIIRQQSPIPACYVLRPTPVARFMLHSSSSWTTESMDSTIFDIDTVE